MAHPLNEFSENVIKSFRTLIDADAIIGDPIDAGEGTTIIPVSKVAFGFGTGGGDLPSSQKAMFAGGNGGGVTISPIAFLIIRNGEVKVQQIQSFQGAADRVVGMVPEVFDKVTGFINSRKEKQSEGSETAEASK